VPGGKLNRGMAVYDVLASIKGAEVGRLVCAAVAIVFDLPGPGTRTRKAAWDRPWAAGWKARPRPGAGTPESQEGHRVAARAASVISDCAVAGCCTTAVT
jgi:hypothetical protein